MAGFLKTIGIVLLASGLCAACAAALLGRAGGDGSAASAAQPVTGADRTLAAAVKARLQSQATLRPYTIGVDSRGAAITLTGRVRAASELAAAERIARGVKGVKSVRNLLTLE
jgi:hyperosmotically inducible periplasmic protein